MDPFSIATGVVGLAQGIVELVKLAQSLRASFAKVSENRRNAKALVSEILESVEFIQRFYERNCAPGEEFNVEMLWGVILDLRNSLSSILLQCTALIPQADQGRLSRSKVALRAWLKRSEIESQIQELRTLVDRATLKFVAYATMDSSVTNKVTLGTVIRLESKTSEIHQRIVVRRQTKEAEDKSPGTQAAESSEIRQTFTTHYKRQSINIAHLPLTGEQATDLFLRTQVANIDRLLSRIAATNSITIPKPTNSIPNWEISMRLAPTADYETLQQRLAIQTCELFDLLKKPEALSPNAFLDISGTLDAIGCQYRLLELSREASVLQSWGLRVVREAHKAYPSVYGPRLAHALENHAATLLRCPGGLASATASIVEAIGLYRDALVEEPSNMKKIRLAAALHLSFETSRFAGDSEQGQKDIRECIGLLQEVIAEGYGTQLIDEITLDPHSFIETRFETRVRPSDWRAMSLVTYGQALAAAFWIAVAPQEALKDANSARKIFLKVHKHVPGAYSSQLWLLDTEIVTYPYFRDILKGEEAQTYLDEALIHLDFIPPRADNITQDLTKYTIHMGRAVSFRNSGRFPEAVEASNLAAIHLERTAEVLQVQAGAALVIPERQFSTIRRAIYDEAELAMETEGKAQSWYDTEGAISTHRLPFVRNGQRSIDARLAAIGQLVDKVAAKAQQDPKPLTDAAYGFCHSAGSILYGAFSLLQKFDEAYHFAQHVHRLIQHAPEQYWRPDLRNRSLLDALWYSTDAASGFVKEPRAITWVEEAIGVATKIAPDPTPDQWRYLAPTYANHCLLLETHDRPTEALEMWKKAVDHSRRYNRSKPSDPKGVHSRLLSIGLAQNHIQAGRLSTALKAITDLVQSALAIERPVGYTNPRVNSWRVGVIVLHINTLQQLGRTEEAMECLGKATKYLLPSEEQQETSQATERSATTNHETITLKTPSSGSDVPVDLEDGRTESEPLDQGVAGTNDGAELEPCGGSPGCKWGLPLLSLKAFLLSQQVKYSQAVAVASWALDTFDPLGSSEAKAVDSVIATLYPRMWLDFSSVFADAGRPSTAIHYAHCAKKHLSTLCPPPTTPPAEFFLLSARVDHALALASFLLQDRHLEDASKVLLQQIDICKINVDRRRELYPHYAMAMRLLGLYYCSVGDHAEGIRWRKKVVGLEYMLEEDPEVFGVVKKRIVWEESRPSSQRLRDVLDIKCTHQAPVF